MWLECMPLSRVQLPRVHGLRHAPAFPDDLGLSHKLLPGFSAHFLIDAGEGVLTSVGLFETSDQAHQSTRLAASWIRENDLASALPNTPKITAGPLIVQARPAAAPTEAVLAHA